MDELDMFLLKEMKCTQSLPECMEKIFLFEKLLQIDMNNNSRNNSLFSSEDVYLLISSMKIEISHLKDIYKSTCSACSIEYDEPNFYTMINPNYSSNRKPNITLLKALISLLFDFQDNEFSAINEIQSLDNTTFHIICKKIKHCMLVSFIDNSKELCFIDNDSGNKIIEENFSGLGSPAHEYWLKLNKRKLYIEQYRIKENVSFSDNFDDINSFEFPYNDYLHSECADFFPTISLDDYYSFEKKVNSIPLYHINISNLQSDSFLDYLKKFNKLITHEHFICRLPLQKLVWLEKYGTKYLTHNNPIFLHILFHLLFTSREDRNNITFSKLEASLNISPAYINDYMNELERLINFPMIPEIEINDTIYNKHELFFDVHHLFFFNTPSWFKFLILNFDNSHLRAAKYLYYEFYIQRMHLKKTKEKNVLLELKKYGLSDEDINILYSLCKDEPIHTGLVLHHK